MSCNRRTAGDLSERANQLAGMLITFENRRWSYYLPVPNKQPDNGASGRLETKLKEVTVEIEKDILPMISHDSGTIVKMINCRPHGMKGMTEFVEIISNSPINDALARITNHANTSHTSFKIFDEARASGLIATHDSPLCRMIWSLGGFCKTCPLELGSDQGSKINWRIVLESNSSVNSFLETLVEKGIKVNTVDYGDLKESGLLTLREEQAIRLAQDLGYFHFPRKTSIRELSSALSICPSTLDEILRRAEGKIVKSHIRKPNGITSKKEKNRN
ncbi:MAG: helix-turn-helix domain-containing protein [Nitrososphaerales archaeon]